VKNKYYIKNTAAAGVGFTIAGVWSVCVYIFYTARGDQVRSPLFWDLTQRRMVFLYRRFGTSYSPVFKGKQFRKNWTVWPLKTGETGCPETSVLKYHSALRKIPEERWSDNTRIPKYRNNYVYLKICVWWMLFSS
jgi:hypothetical protein